MDVTQMKVPAYLEPAGGSGAAKIISTSEKVFVFRIEWPRPQIRNDS